ncbi:methyltransferase domain-containing protein [Verrucomicrobium sp. 3C]|uniref:class I SAM-dependent methyltransferase n=1 Tax=Verrucomicrobium sp. 3C TaxID=1134055 RepID=UPI00035F1B67|nr:methyltransferase domain-containing protein [Verrucomicrobium sp. 3C]
MKLYVGANGMRPEGYQTIDIDPATRPDVVADLRDMAHVPTGSVEEIVANAVLEHIEWPDAFQALSEMVRILKVGGQLKISVPDMALYARRLIAGDNSFHLMAVIYGVGGRVNSHQAHRFGYTPGMLCDLAELLGCGKFDWFDMNGFQDAAGGWMPRAAGPMAEALNFCCTKLGAPPVPPDDLYKAMVAQPMTDPLVLAGECKAGSGVAHAEAEAPSLYQRLHYKYTDLLMRCKQLERGNAEARQARDELARIQRSWTWRLGVRLRQWERRLRSVRKVLFRG